MTKTKNNFPLKNIFLNNKTISIIFIFISFIVSNNTLGTTTNINNKDSIPEHWQTFSNTPNFHIFIFPKITFINNSLHISYGDCIGVFYKNDKNLKCCGASVITNKDNISVIGFGNDIFTEEKDGFIDGDTIYWMVYKHKNNTEELFEVIYIEGENLFSEYYFNSFAISIIDTIFESTNTIYNFNNTNKYKKAKIYPNPFRNKLNISIETNNNTNLNINKIIIYNLFGEIIYSKYLTNNSRTITIDSKKFDKGYYFILIYYQTNKELFKVLKI